MSLRSTLMHGLSRSEHAFSRGPGMDFGHKQSGFASRIIFQQGCGLIGPDAENSDCPQLAWLPRGESAGDGDLSLRRQLLNESAMLSQYLREPGRVRIPFVAALHEHERVLFHSLRSGWRVNRVSIDEPGSVYFGGKAACLDRRIAISPVLRLPCRAGLEHEDTSQRCVLYEWPGDHEFVFGSHLPDVGHVLFLQLFTGLFAQLRSVSRAIQQYEEIQSGLGARIGSGLSESRVRNREQAQQ